MYSYVYKFYLWWGQDEPILSALLCLIHKMLLGCKRTLNLFILMISQKNIIRLSARNGTVFIPLPQARAKTSALASTSAGTLTLLVADVTLGEMKVKLKIRRIALFNALGFECRI